MVHDDIGEIRYRPRRSSTAEPSVPSGPITDPASAQLYGSRVTYSYMGTMRVKPGYRDEVVALMLRDQSALAEIGCRSYLVGVNDEDPDLVYVSEVWDSKQAHDDSLKLESVKAVIATVMPMLTGEFDGHEFTVVGGLGAPAGTAATA